MEIDKLKQHMLTKPEVSETFPFGADVPVFKVKNKMFALIGERNGYTMLNVKCDPNESLALQDVFPNSITAGYHMNKKHWISIYFDGKVPDGEIERLVDSAYLLVVKGMTKKDQASILVQM